MRVRSPFLSRQALALLGGGSGPPGVAQPDPAACVVQPAWVRARCVEVSCRSVQGRAWQQTLLGWDVPCERAYPVCTYEISVPARACASPPSVSCYFSLHLLSVPDQLQRCGSEKSPLIVSSLAYLEWSSECQCRHNGQLLAILGVVCLECAPWYFPCLGSEHNQPSVSGCLHLPQFISGRPIAVDLSQLYPADWSSADRPVVLNGKGALR